MPQIEQRLEKTAPPLAEDKKEAASSVLVRFTLSCSKMTGSEDKMRAMSLSRLPTSDNHHQTWGWLASPEFDPLVRGLWTNAFYNLDKYIGLLRIWPPHWWVNQPQVDRVWGGRQPKARAAAGKFEEFAEAQICFCLRLQIILSVLYCLIKDLSVRKFTRQLL